MLKLRDYTKEELSLILGTRDRQGMKDKLDRYGVIYDIRGRGNNAIFTIKEIRHPFKLYAILDLEVDANTDFDKLLKFYFRFFNDDVFQSMPDLAKEDMMREDNAPISRQTVDTYISRLEKKGMIIRSNVRDDCIFYLADKHYRKLCDKETYKQAWREYFALKDAGAGAMEAINDMKAKYGGVARKEYRIYESAFCVDEVQYMLKLIQMELEGEVIK